MDINAQTFAAVWLCMPTHTYTHLPAPTQALSKEWVTAYHYFRSEHTPEKIMCSILPWMIWLKTEGLCFPPALISEHPKEYTPTVFSVIDFFTLAA